MKLNTTAGFPKQDSGQSGLENYCGAPAQDVDSVNESTEQAMIPAGETVLLDTIFDRYNEPVEQEHSVYVESFFIDRFTVTNADYAAFVESGGYTDMSLWPKKIWPHVLQFVDQSGDPGPRYWKRGRPEKQLVRHPVVGVSWFEANAYAQWTGKKLPTSSQWQRAGTWASDGSQTQSLFPWSGGFQSGKANIWISGKHSTVEVDQYYEGSTANGIYQLVGNVWEWVASKFTIQNCRQPDLQARSNLIELRGGAFDTYLESQANCLFRTGQPFLFRGRNVGFRCCKKNA